MTATTDPATMMTVLFVENGRLPGGGLSCIAMKSRLVYQNAYCSQRISQAAEEYHDEANAWPECHGGWSERVGLLLKSREPGYNKGAASEEPEIRQRKERDCQ